MTIIDYLPTLKDNPYFSAGFGLVGVGTGLALLRKCSQYGFIFFKRNYMLTMEIPSKDKSYEWVLKWISLNTLQTRHISVETFYKQQDNGKISTEFNFIPSLGNHFFLYQNSWIKMERNRESNVVDLNTGTPWESLTLTTFGQNSIIFKRLLDEARTLALKNLGDKTVLYTAIGTDWRTFGFPRKKRPIESVILDSHVSEEIVTDIKEFIQSSQWYSDRGIPYRRGYLLYGPPGCGKSSFIKALAGMMNYSICVLNLSERGLTDDRLNHLLTVAPEQSIILLEDVDAAFCSREDSPQIAKAYEGLSRLTFSGLLNALDGVAAAEARILFMTTNYYDRLDPALIRPGRVDFTQYIGYATDYQLMEMFKKFYPNSSPYQAELFCSKTREHLNGKQISAAQIQGYFMFNKHDPEAALKFIKNVTQIENKHTSHDDKLKVA